MKKTIFLTAFSLLTGCSWFESHPKEAGEIEQDLTDVVETIIKGEPKPQ